jgi:hypothetical protein
LFERYTLRNADSLGMNEQELKFILKLWKNELDESMKVSSDSKPSFVDVLHDLKEFFRVIKEKEY